MTDITFYTARELVKSIKTNELSATEVMQAHLDRINAVNDKVNALVNVNETYALEEAKKIDNLPSLAKRGKLLGLPIAIKDIHDAKGYPTTFGFDGLKDSISDIDEISVERLRAEG